MHVAHSMHAGAATRVLSQLSTSSEWHLTPTGATQNAPQDLSAKKSSASLHLAWLVGGGNGWGRGGRDRLSFPCCTPCKPCCVGVRGHPTRPSPPPQATPAVPQRPIYAGAGSWGTGWGAPNSPHRGINTLQP